MDAVRDLLADGPAVGLLTRGPSGALVITRTAEVAVPSPRTKVVDTIGAGDAFGGGFVAWWHARGLGREDLGTIDPAVAATEFACLVAARTCARPGASPAAAVGARGRGARLTSPPLGELVARARALAGTGGRRVLGIAGAPGSGKSTLARARRSTRSVRTPPGSSRWTASTSRRRSSSGSGEQTARARPTRSTLTVTRRCCGACARTTTRSSTPRSSDREIEEPIACAVPVPAIGAVGRHGGQLPAARRRRLWARVRPLLDEAWFVEGDDDRRREWLIARHVAFGKSPDYAREWVHRSDEVNAELVASTRSSADLVVRVE